MTRRVGVSGFGYPEARNVSSLPMSGYEFVRAIDTFSVINSIHRRVLGPTHATSILNCLFLDFGLSNVDLLHLFNSISYAGHPWLVTFEHYLPRWNVHSELGMRLLAQPLCRKVIAMSKFAFDYQMFCLDEFPAYKETIRRKMCTLTPAQDAVIASYDEKPLERDVVTCTFVGHDFFRKGGLDVLHAFVRLVGEGLPVRLNIVSSMMYGDYASRSSQTDVLTARSLMQKLGDRVRHYPELNNDEVLKLFTASDIGLLPTYDDTYGFSVLEAQAAGCPVISTDICALPEINNDAIGWLIPVPKDRFGIAFRFSVEQRASLSSIIQARLYTIMRDICSNRTSIREKGTRSLDRIRSECKTEERVTFLQGLYQNVLQPEPQAAA